MIAEPHRDIARDTKHRRAGRDLGGDAELPQHSLADDGTLDTGTDVRQLRRIEIADDGGNRVAIHRRTRRP
jgi:hypothetical protein